MTRIKSLLLTLVAVAAIVPAVADAQSINHRERHQWHRIHQGVRSGGLTWHERNRLAREEARVRRSEWRDRRDGHRYTLGERRHTQRELNKVSRDIWRLKHNGRHRG
ncbi:hypothetical protein [Fimbriimonas ginsengisoli]|uniref:Uncharacterized protein n=1 Tax=Fimbriimonas ginsengisoli Gsoil 348 TaxID=661478 RepID=A0A068NQQ3_FIMGI|nr:hypothetical protein [Fimbriimonas ginsengisoli]AIE85888.1 hypothetical protein OP10G_2520 [Fimbriimonas ginsengisoli Gsoil 348]